MRPQIRSHQEERLPWITSAEKVKASVRYPVGGMVFFFVYPWPCDPAVAVKSGICYIGVCAEFLLQPVKVIIGNKLRLPVRYASIARAVQITVVEIYMIETEVVAERMNVHFPYALGIVPCF